MRTYTHYIPAPAIAEHHLVLTTQEIEWMLNEFSKIPHNTYTPQLWRLESELKKLLEEVS